MTEIINPTSAKVIEYLVSNGLFDGEDPGNPREIPFAGRHSGKGVFRTEEERASLTFSDSPHVVTEDGRKADLRGEEVEITSVLVLGAYGLDGKRHAFCRPQFLYGGVSRTFRDVEQFSRLTLP